MGQPRDARVYTARNDNENVMSVQFGDGKTSGARLSTGRNNVAAKYRQGIGRDGNVAAGSIKLLTAGAGTLLTAVPQSAAAGYGSFIVGQAAKYYFEHGASWGSEGPKTIVQRILNETDKASVVSHLKDEIRKKLSKNPHAR